MKIVSTLEHTVWEDHRLEVRLAATDPSFDAALREQIAATFRRHPRLPDHRDEFPWVTSYLGDPHAPVWFLGEYPSLTQVERGTDATPQDQWAISKGDELFRQALFKHGFKEGSEMIALLAGAATSRMWSSRCTEHGSGIGRMRRARTG